jgi:hypothetical protein
MSILTDLLHKKITWQTAVTQIEAWGAKLVAGNPILQATAGAVMSDLKQAASDAITLADTAAGPLIATGAEAVNVAFAAAAKAYLGPFGAVVSPAAHDAIDRIAAGLKAEIDMAAAQMKAGLAQPAPVTLGGPPTGLEGSVQHVLLAQGAAAPQPASF